MSASKSSSAVFVTDDATTIKNKINKHAFSGGGATKEEQEANGDSPMLRRDSRCICYAIIEMQRMITPQKTLSQISPDAIIEI